MGESAYLWVHSTLGRPLAWLSKATRGPNPGAVDVVQLHQFARLRQVLM